MLQYQIPTKFHLSDAVSKLNELNLNDLTDTETIDGYPETNESLKNDLIKVID